MTLNNEGAHALSVADRLGRRSFLRLTAAAAAGSMLGGFAGRRAYASPASPETSGAGAAAGPGLVRYPEKVDLILHTDRPPNLEMPVRYLREDFTPNDAFFVRWHLANIPTRVDPQSFQLSVAGHVEQPLDLSLDELRKQFEPVTLAAVNQCSGNSRRFFAPRVAGGQWGNGAMGNAKWTGVRLRDLLRKARVKAGAVDVSFQGLDRPPQASVSPFVKSLAFDRADDGECLVAYEMNDQPLPLLNGYPLRLIVPGWYGTYWVKSLSEITVLNEKFKGFWMDKAYRAPDNPEYQESPKDQAKQTVPITKMLVRSLFVSPGPGKKVKAGAAVEVEGLALDGGDGIRKVEVSADEGSTWSEAKLGPELGKYAWRRWHYTWSPAAAGAARLLARATNAAGQTQPAEQNWNRAGYARNKIEALEVTVEG